VTEIDDDLLAALMRRADPVAAALAEEFGLEACDGGYRVKDTGTHWVDVTRQIYNWRICRIPRNSPMTWDRGWCYAGTGPASFTAAVLAAMAWDGADGSEPAGWNKNIQTGEWRPPAS
jgi:hypothetical protein